MDADIVFRNLENILNYSSSVIMKEAIEVLWLKKHDEFEASGFVKIGNKITKIEASYNGAELTIWIWIGKNALKFEFSNEEITKVVEWVRQQ